MWTPQPRTCNRADRDRMISASHISSHEGFARRGVEHPIPVRGALLEQDIGSVNPCDDTAPIRCDRARRLLGITRSDRNIPRATPTAIAPTPPEDLRIADAEVFYRRPDD